MAFQPKHTIDNRRQKPDLSDTVGTNVDHPPGGADWSPSKEWRRHARAIRQIAVRLTESPTLNAVEQVAALTHVADELEAEAEDYTAA